MLFRSAYDFGRDRVVNSKHLKGAEVDLGAMAKVTKIVGVGARAEDIGVNSRGQAWVNVMFEDKDLANLFGLVTFGSLGKKGRGK